MCKQLRKWIFEQTYGYPVEQLTAQSTAEIQQDIIGLRTAYQNDVCPKKYATEAERNAYMITYYLTYIKPVESIIDRNLDKALLQKKELHLTFYAGGPCPELYGMLRALRGNGYEGRIATTIYDEQEWTAQQNITRKLCWIEKLFRAKDLMHIVSRCDNRRSCGQCDRWRLYCRQESARTDIFCMQNYLSHVRAAEEILPELRERIHRAKPGAVFLLVDLQYQTSRAVLRELASTCAGEAEVVATNIHGACERVCCTYGHDGLEKIFTGEDNLTAKKWTNYYYLMLRKH